MESILKEFKDSFRFRYVVLAYVENNLKLRYRRSTLGFAWSVLAPAINYALIGFVFTMLMRDRRSDYFIYYFAGANFFSIISGILNRAPLIFIQNESYIKKISLPKLIFVLNAVAMELVNFALSSIVLICLGIGFGALKISGHVFLAFVPIVLICFFLIGLTCLFAVATVFFRDLIHIGPAFVQAVFFFTPVIYDQNMIPEPYKEWIKFNPFYYFLELFRSPILEQKIPDLSFYLIASLLAVVTFFYGVRILKKFDNQIVFKL